jgi:deoxyribodipyrimidine photolyase-related protein
MTNILIYSHQLFENCEIIKENSTVYLIEHPHFFTKYKFNVNKLVYHKATTMYYNDYLIQKYKNIKVKYICFNKYENIKNKLYKMNIEIYNPIEMDLINELKNYKNVKIYESPMFLNTVTDLTKYKSTQKSKSYLMNSFYIWQRKKNKLFVKDDKPYFGKWSFDKENRKKFPNDFNEKNLIFKNKYVTSACKYFNVEIKDLHCWLPITFKEVDTFFKNFIKHKIEKFGDYEDAISKNIKIGNHSLLSAVLNIGMIIPKIIITKLKKLEKKTNFESIFNSIEGFARQIIGWREYMRYIYLFEHKNMITNELNHKMKIKNFDKIISDIPIIDDTFAKINKNGWIHHIERLMVIGNYFLLCQIHPNDVYKYFYSKVCLDAYDWVMVGNVYGMSQYASKIKISTKPYICGSNYLLKMSDYKKGDWCYTMDCLFYNFIKNNYAMLKANYSSAILTKMYDKNKNKEEMCSFAKKYISEKFKK